MTENQNNQSAASSDSQNDATAPAEIPREPAPAAEATTDSETSESNQTTSEARPSEAKSQDSLKNMAMACWILHIVGPFTSGILTLIAGIMAIIKKPDAAGTIYADHFQQAARVFFWGIASFVLAMVCVALSAVTFGASLMIATIIGLWYFVYVLVKGIKGAMRVNEGRAYAN